MCGTVAQLSLNIVEQKPKLPLNLSLDMQNVDVNPKTCKCGQSISRLHLVLS